MQFKYPELLYALFVLLIPILVHLFQLQRYTKVPFTNVQLLKSIQKETRKSARLKKWLVLITRLLAFACLVIAFAQPFSSENNSGDALLTNIYIDNSLSMKAKGSNGELLRAQINAIIENNTYANDKVRFFSNYNSFNQTTSEQLKEALITLNYQPYPVNFETELVRLQTELGAQKNSRLVVLSDFQDYQFDFPELLNSLSSETVLVSSQPNASNNISIDSVYTSDYSATNITINAVIKSQSPTNGPLPVTLYNGPGIYGKTSITLSDNTGIASFSIPTNDSFYGRLVIEDQSLEFDNNFYFTYASPETIHILSIGTDAPYLRKVFDQETFDYRNTALNQVNFAELSSEQFIILNELKSMSTALISQMKEFIAKGGHVLVIPNEDANSTDYNRLFEALEIGSIQAKQESTLKITNINFEHPIFNKVFDRTIDNFQYPVSNAHFIPNFSKASTILSFQNNASFINASTVENGQLYYVSAPLSGSTSNFKDAPLIVPIFYNMATQSHGIQEIQYTIDAQNTIRVNTSITQDDVLTIQNEAINYIPIQKVSKNKVSLVLGDQIQKSGFYDILKSGSTIKRIALNYSRKESALNYASLESLSNTSNISITTSIQDLLSQIDTSYKINWYFKWFLAFSVLFLFFEMLILKYFKL